MIKGNVDLIAINEISGWAACIDDASKKCIVHVQLKDKELVSGEAKLFRADLKNATIGNGNCAFLFKFNPPIPNNQLNNIKVFAEIKIDDAKRSNASKVELTIGPNAIKDGGARRSYQSFHDSIGDSNSNEKLKRLRLPNLKGKSFLDLGCNEGYFCNFAVRQGASRVLGIDINPEIIKLARKRTPEAEFLNKTWWDLSEEKFDIILFTSAIHYEHEQRKLLSFLKDRLNTSGVLILECGIYQNIYSHWYLAQRHDGSLRYPNINYLIDVLLDGYAVTSMGRSVDQPGDPIPRFVFHCSERRPIILLVYGPSNSGKSILARNIARNAIPSYSIDNLFHRIINGPLPAKSKLCSFIKAEGDLLKLDTLSAKIVAAGLTNELVEMMVLEAPLQSEIAIIEGEMLVYEEFRKLFTAYLARIGCFVWDVHRSS